MAAAGQMKIRWYDIAEKPITWIYWASVNWRSGMAQLCAKKSDLKRAFIKHYELYNSLQPNHHQMTRKLILFYAIETGLKYYLLGIIHKSNTDELHQYYDDIGHDIRRMLKEANRGGQFILEGFLTEGKQWAEPGQFHQMWRYGIRAKETGDENKAETVLKKIVEWLDSIINQ
jgi:hypothetical protein